MQKLEGKLKVNLDGKVYETKPGAEVKYRPQNSPGSTWLDEKMKDPKFRRAVESGMTRVRLRGQYIVKHMGVPRRERRELAALAIYAKRGTLPKSKVGRLTQLAQKLDKVTKNAPK